MRPSQGSKAPLRLLFPCHYSRAPQEPRWASWISTDSSLAPGTKQRPGKRVLRTGEVLGPRARRACGFPLPFLPHPQLPPPPRKPNCLGGGSALSSYRDAANTGDRARGSRKRPLPSAEGFAYQRRSAAHAARKPAHPTVRSSAPAPPDQSEPGKQARRSLRTGRGWRVRRKNRQRSL